MGFEPKRHLITTIAGQGLILTFVIIISIFNELKLSLARYATTRSRSRRPRRSRR